MGLYCSFRPGKDKGGDWKFSLAGPNQNAATGSFTAGSETIRVAAKERFKGASFMDMKPAKYEFYSGDKIVAGVNVKKKKGPVWMLKELNSDVKDAIAIVAAALLLK